MPEKVESLSYGTEGLMLVLGFGEKIDSEDRQRIGFERGAIFFFWVLLGFMYYLVLEKKNQNFFIKIMLTWKIVELSKKGQRLQIYIY